MTNKKICHSFLFVKAALILLLGMFTFSSSVFAINPGGEEHYPGDTSVLMEQLAE